MKEPPPQLKRTRSGNTKEPPPKPTYRCVKTSLKSVAKNNLVMDKLPARDLHKDNVRYDIQCSPQDYLPCMLRMMMAVETHDTSVKNVCPLRSNVMPKHIRIDTTSLAKLCFTKKQGKKTDYLTGGDRKDRKDTIWPETLSVVLRL